MKSIELPTRKVSVKDSLVLGVLLSGSALVLLENLAALFHRHPPFALLALSALTLAAVLMLASFNLERAVTLHPEERILVIASTIFGWRRRRRVDLSDCTWVRAKGDRGKAVPFVRIQAGNPGYKTVQLMAIPGTGPKEVEVALEWCARIAEALQVENKGYREVW